MTIKISFTNSSLLNVFIEYHNIGLLFILMKGLGFLLFSLLPEPAATMTTVRYLFIFYYKALALKNISMKFVASSG